MYTCQLYTKLVLAIPVSLDSVSQLWKFRGDYSFISLMFFPPPAERQRSLSYGNISFSILKLFPPFLSKDNSEKYRTKCKSTEIVTKLEWRSVVRIFKGQVAAVPNFSKNVRNCINRVDASWHIGWVTGISLQAQ